MAICVCVRSVNVNMPIVLRNVDMIITNLIQLYQNWFESNIFCENYCDIKIDKNKGER